MYKTARDWILEKEKEGSTFIGQLADRQPAPRGPKEDPPSRFSGHFSMHKLGKLVWGGGGGGKNPTRRC